MSWKPAPRADLDPSTLPLDALQRILLSQLDGTDNVAALAEAMRLPIPRMESLLAELVAMGAVDAEGRDARAPEDPGLPPDVADPPPAGPEPSWVDEPPATEQSNAEAAETATHRQLYERSLHRHPVDERAASAQQALEPELSAYCFDPMPKVIQAILENPAAGLAQARLIATHHRTSTGLEAVASRAPYANDVGVRRGLLQNPQLPGTVFRRLWSPRRLAEQYLVSVSHDAPEQTRRLAREVLRASFLQRTAEERVELIFGTEGRCLAQLAGLTVDGKTTALLCRRTYVSTLLIQNIARWSAAPPQLIVHLRRQDAVRRNPQLRLMLERHPNAS
ncbi:MAG: hypothetical protein IPQ13_05910 [Holophagaceae bacterium]|nr:hypothetical protein [Holophagaceae bacterium]